MSNILPFKPNPFKPKAEELPETNTVTEEAFCVGCKHKWQETLELPMNTNVLECPSCNSMKGFLTVLVMKGNAPAFTCGYCQGFIWTMFQGPDGPSACCTNCASEITLLSVFDQASKQN